MAFDITQFRSKLTGDGARPTLFRVILNPPAFVGFPTEQFSFMCKAASLPSSIIGHAEPSYFGRRIKVGGDRQFDDWTVLIINDESFDLRDAFERWQGGIASYSTVQNAQRNSGATSNPNSYVGNATVQQYSKEGDIIKEIQIVNMLPTMVGQIEVNWDANDTIEEFDVTFTYDFFVSDSAQ